MTTKELSPSHWRHCEAKSGIMRQAGNNKEHLIFVRLQTDAIGKVAAMVIACIERKPEQFCVGDESQVVSNVVQNELRALRHIMRVGILNK